MLVKHRFLKHCTWIPDAFMAFVFTPDTCDFLLFHFYTRYIFKVSNSFEYLNTFISTENYSLPSPTDRELVTGKKKKLPQYLQ